MLGCICVCATVWGSFPPFQVPRGYINGRLIATEQCAPIENEKKNGWNLVFFAEIWYKWFGEGPKITFFLFVEKVQVVQSVWHIPVLSNLKSRTPWSITCDVSAKADFFIHLWTNYKLWFLYLHQNSDQ